jgi:hypothetical protein
MACPCRPILNRIIFPVSFFPALPVFARTSRKSPGEAYHSGERDRYRLATNLSHVKSAGNALFRTTIPLSVAARHSRGLVMKSIIFVSMMAALLSWQAITAKLLQPPTIPARQSLSAAVGHAMMRMPARNFLTEPRCWRGWQRTKILRRGWQLA